MPASKIQLGNLAYAQHLYKSVLGALIILAALVAFGMTRPSASNQATAHTTIAAARPQQIAPIAEATASVR